MAVATASVSIVSEPVGALLLVAGSTTPAVLLVADGANEDDRVAEALTHWCSKHVRPAQHPTTFVLKVPHHPPWASHDGVSTLAAEDVGKIRSGVDLGGTGGAAAPAGARVVAAMVNVHRRLKSPRPDGLNASGHTRTHTPTVGCRYLPFLHTAHAEPSPPSRHLWQFLSSRLHVGTTFECVAAAAAAAVRVAATNVAAAVDTAVVVVVAVGVTEGVAGTAVVVITAAATVAVAMVVVVIVVVVVVVVDVVVVVLVVVVVVVVAVVVLVAVVVALVVVAVVAVVAVVVVVAATVVVVAAAAAAVVVAAFVICVVAAVAPVVPAVGMVGA